MTNTINPLKELIDEFVSRIDVLSEENHIDEHAVTSLSGIVEWLEEIRTCYLIVH